jgi:hypothetical protein
MGNLSISKAEVFEVLRESRWELSVGQVGKAGGEAMLDLR